MHGALEEARAGALTETSHHVFEEARAGALTLDWLHVILHLSRRPRILSNV